MAWFDRYFTPEWKERFKNQSKKQFFNNPSLAEEAFQDAWGKLFEILQSGDAKRIPEDGRGPYVRTIFKNLLLDVHRKHFGRCRPYQWVKRLGRLWEDAALLLCQEKLPTAAMVERICNNPQHASDNTCAEKVEKAIRQLHLKPFCRLAGIDETGPEEINPVDEKSPTPEQQLERGDLVSLVETLLALKHSAIDASPAVNHIVEKWQQISDQIALDDDERLILTRVYLENDSMKQTAQVLRLEYHTALRLRDAALARIRSVLEQFSIDLQ